MLLCPAGVVTLDRIFSLQFERTVNRDNTVSFQNLSLQIERVRWRATLAGCQVMVHQHLDGTLSLTHGPHWLGRYSAARCGPDVNEKAAAKGCGKDARWKSQKTDFSTALGNPAKYAGFPLSHSLDDCGLINLQNRTFHLLQKADILTCYEQRGRGCSPICRRRQMRDQQVRLQISLDTPKDGAFPFRATSPDSSLEQWQNTSCRCFRSFCSESGDGQTCGADSQDRAFETPRPAAANPSRW